MISFRFNAGDRVSFVPGPLDSNVRRGTYTVVRALPDAGRGRQYRVRHIEEQHERVIDESQLRPASAAA